MLYELWREVAARHAGRLALADLASARSWSFGELAAEVESLPKVGSVVFPSGEGADFVLAVLNGWRDQALVCPVEPGFNDFQTGASATGFAADCATLRERGITHIKTTSATSGVPRRVLFTSRQMVADAFNIVATMGLCADWPNLGVVSLAHSYGFSNAVLPLLLHGVPLVLTGSPLPEPVRRAAQSFSDVTVAAVPALWRAWFEAGSIPPNIRLAISAGAVLPIELETEVFEAHRLKVHNFYGSSECGGIAYDGSAGPRKEAGCVGAPMHGVDVAIGDTRCVEVRGPAVGASYWPEPEPDLAEGRFRTSDLGVLRDGLLFLQGRAGDLIHVAGRKVSPETIERALEDCSGVGECLVFGVPSPGGERGEMVVACVVLKSGLTPAELKRQLLARLPAWQVPREWWPLETLATNHRGKLSRAEWRRRFLETRARG